MNAINRYIGEIAASVAFLASFGFFQTAYPYHLIRREQMSLFLYDWNYICQTYKGVGWLSRLFGDFLEQFFLLPAAGPLSIALLLTAIGTVTYKICRKFTGKVPSLAVASAIFVWSFMRETGNLYVTRYTIVVLCYLSLVLLALQFRRIWARSLAAIVLVAAGIWALGAPVHNDYGKFWSFPKFEYDRLIGLDDEVSREHWDKVLKLSEKDLYTVEASYCYNLAQAMKGQLGNKLFDHSQGEAYDLLLRVVGGQSTFDNCLAGEAWYHLGSMNIAEQSAITALQTSPNHTGARYIKRLANIALATGEDAAAQKYLNILSKTLFYGKWAKSMLPENQSDETKAKLDELGENLAVTDFVHLSDKPRAILLGLLEANPDNRLAREYLLCYDLMRYDLDQFMEDYTPDRIDADIYHEAALIWLSQKDMMTERAAAGYGIDLAMVKKMSSFFRFPERYRNTYWYYYMKALNASAQ